MHYASALKFKLIYMYNIELKFDLYLYIFLMHVAHVFRMKETFIYLHIVLFFFFTLIRVLYPCELPIITLILARIIHFQNIVCFFLKTHSQVFNNYISFTTMFEKACIKVLKLNDQNCERRQVHEQRVFSTQKTKLGVKSKVNHCNYNDSTVLDSTCHKEVAIQTLGVKLESSTTKTVGGDRFRKKVC